MFVSGFGSMPHKDLVSDSLQYLETRGLLTQLRGEGFSIITSHDPRFLGGNPKARDNFRLLFRFYLQTT